MPPSKKQRWNIAQDKASFTFPYLRLHGRDAKAYLTGETGGRTLHYAHSGAEITEVNERASSLADKADEVRVAFHHNRRDFAPGAAM